VAGPAYAAERLSVPSIARDRMHIAQFEHIPAAALTTKLPVPFTLAV
jgi:hypothetical protein